MNHTERVKNMYSPYASIAKQLAIDTDFADRFAHVKDSDRYDLGQMMPKVTYDDWIVCLYKADGKLYRINMEDCEIKEVVVAEVLEYNERYEPVDANGNVVANDNLDNYCDNLCCGESDDMSCYIYFGLADN